MSDIPVPDIRIQALDRVRDTIEDVTNRIQHSNGEADNDVCRIELAVAMGLVNLVMIAIIEGRPASTEDLPF